MIGSLYAGITGLKANTSAMSVIGDNIANVDTTGFKTSRVTFANVFNATLGGQGALQIGRGVTMSGVAEEWQAGALENTNSPTDLSINGRGMFIIRDEINSTQYYSRAGKFDFDKDGFLMNQDGFRVQGFPLDATGGMSGPLSDITLPLGTNAPVETSEITFGLNLDAGEDFTALPAPTWDTTLTAYDSLGTPVELTFNFTKSSATTWDYYVSSSVGTVTAPVSGGEFTLAFDATGSLDPANCVPASADPTIAIGSLPGNDLSIDWTYLTGTATDGSVTGYDANSVKTSQTQDGHPSGTLQGISVDEDGMFTALYSNGTMTPFYQVALADFASYSNLAKMGSNMYSESLASGQPVISAPGIAGVGSIAPNALEMSNVDLATEFVELITTQRAFQANSKVITTSDEVLSDLINIKR
ncbi:MAG: flagellar hook protein FlgE [Desulfobacteraceae bacterium]|nr:flagellar hook protein FlgE [Desulfobacteraceae bacterium]